MKNPYDKNFEDYKSQNSTEKTAISVFQDKPFSEEHKSAYGLARVLKTVANVVSGVSALIAFYLALNAYFGTVFAVCIGFAVCGLLEGVKNHLWRTTAKSKLKYKKASMYAVLLLISVHAFSLASSVFGAWKLPTLMPQVPTAEVALIDIDAITSAQANELKTLDSQIKTAGAGASKSSTMRRTFKSLSKQKATARAAHRDALRVAREENARRESAHAEEVALASALHVDNIQQARITCVGCAVLFELLYIVSSLFVVYYLFRVYLDAEEKPQAKPKVKAKPKQVQQEVRINKPLKPKIAPSMGFKTYSTAVGEVNQCQHCGSGYLKRAIHQKYCSDKCRHTANKLQKQQKNSNL